jgi:hypothetical protein
VSLQGNDSQNSVIKPITTGDYEGFPAAKEAAWRHSEKYLCTADFYAVAVT